MRRFQHVAGFPSDSTIMYSVNTNGIKNSPFTQRDVELSKEMLGPSKYVAKGKTTRTKPDAVNVTLQRVDIPRTIKQFYSNAVLSVDVMFLNDVPFLTSISEHMHYGIAKPADNLKCMSLESQLKMILRSYAVRGFRVVMIAVDLQFQSLKDRNRVGAPFNVHSTEEHVHNIERWHRTVKERCR